MPLQYNTPHSVKPLAVAVLADTDIYTYACTLPDWTIFMSNAQVLSGYLQTAQSWANTGVVLL